MGALTKASQLCDEAWPLARMYHFAKRAKVLPKDENLAFCYEVLNKVSRSFAIVVQLLPEELRDSVCIFYLVLRALDTVEDDMAIPIKTKVPILQSFHEKIYQRDWKYECGEKEYAKLMKNYPMVTEAFLQLPIAHQEEIAAITKGMGEGMAKFIEREVVTMADYNEYCHYVAGLVGIGLSKLFVTSGLESKDFTSKEMVELSNGMGLFLQKTNIIRDYREDIVEEPAPRMFWPRDVWGKYAKHLEDFKEPENSKEAVQALNALVTNALGHALQSLDYMAKVQHQGIFRFCAIPQVMAIATLAEIYNNPRVFQGVVKVRRGVVARYMLGLEAMPELYRAFHHYAHAIEQRCIREASDDSSSKATLSQSRDIQKRCRASLQRLQEPVIAPPVWGALILRTFMLLFILNFLHKNVVGAFVEHPIGLAALHSVVTAPLLLGGMLMVYSSTRRV